MGKQEIDLWILHAGLSHPSPYFYNFCLELDKYNEFKYIVDANLPFNIKTKNGIVYFNRLKRFYDSNNIKSAQKFLKDVDTLKQNGWKIVWTVHNFFPIDRDVCTTDEYITKEFIMKCDIVFCLSDYMKQSIEKNFKIHAINHGMGLSKLNNEKVNSKILSIPKSDMFTFTFIGNISKYKMLDYVIKEFSKLDNCRLIIAGKESKNANVFIEKLIGEQQNIIYINDYIDLKDWEELSKITNVFISVYDIHYKAFKYGFFPSNYINIETTGIKCISPYGKMIDEIISNKQMIYYDFYDKNGLYNAMKYAIKNKKTNKIKPIIKYNFTWDKTVKIFTTYLKKLMK